MSMTVRRAVILLAGMTSACSEAHRSSDAVTVVAAPDHVFTPKPTPVGSPPSAPNVDAFVGSAFDTTSRAAAARGAANIHPIEKEKQLWLD